MNDDYEINDNVGDSVEELMSSNIKIKPDYYIHNAIIKAQGALLNDDVKSGFIKFRIFIEQVEGLARSISVIKEEGVGEYYEKIKTFKTTLDEKDPKETRDAQISNKKLELLMGEIFKSGAIHDSLKA